jgi:hypothetical protein
MPSESLGKLINYNYLIGCGTSDLSACSVVHYLVPYCYDVLLERTCHEAVVAPFMVLSMYIWQEMDTG